MAVLMVVEAMSEEVEVGVDAVDVLISDRLVGLIKDETDVGTLCRNAGSGLGIPDMVA